MTQCKGTSKRSGQRCKKDAVVGLEVCHIHGGKTPKGIAAPTFIHGRYSKHLPTGLLDAYADAQADPKLLSVRQDVMLIDALISENFKDLEAGENKDAWDDARKLVKQIELGYKGENYGQLESALTDLLLLIDARQNYYAAESALREKIEQRRKLVETEQKIIFQKKNAIPAEQAMTLVSALLDAVKRNVSDPNTLNDIQSEFIRLTGRTHQNRLDAGLITVDS